MAKPTILEFADGIARVPGFEPLTPMWRSTWALVYGLPLDDADVDRLAPVTRRSPAALRSYEGQAFGELWARVGRRGRKSADAALVAVYEANFGDHEQYLMPGELGLIVTISKDLSGAATVRTFAHSYLDAIGIEYREAKLGNVSITRIEGTHLALACLACNSEAPRGPAIPVAILDEIAFWPTSDAYSDPDKQILAALRPAMAQFPGRKLIAISSPFCKQGVFHSTIEAALGNDDDRRTLAVEGPTWVWSPSVTEELTHELEPDPDTHSREYGAIPSDVGSSLVFAASAVDACFEHVVPAGAQLHQAIGVLDMSSGGADSTTAAVVCVAVCPDEWPESPHGCFHHGHKPICNEYGHFVRMQETVSIQVFDTEAKQWVFKEVEPIKHPPLVYLADMLVFPGGFWESRAITGKELMRQIAELYQRWGVRRCYGDRFERGLVRSELEETHGFEFTDMKWTNESKHDSVLYLQRLMRDRQVVCAESVVLRNELKRYQRKPTAGGRWHYAAQGKHHDDCVALLVNAGMCALNGTLAGSELFKRLGGRVVVNGR